MSALPPKADIDRVRRDVRLAKSGHSAPRQELALFDQLISAPAQIERHGNAKGLRSLEVDD
jgi:hypothetical protein